jgi:hypothetical protein
MVVAIKRQKEVRMKSTATLEGVKKAILFPFRGDKWGTKLLIGSAITLALYIPILGIAAIIALAGYFAQIMRQVILQEEDPELPEWKDWGLLFQDGVKVAGATLIYLLPGSLCMLAGYMLFMVLDFALAFSSANIHPGTTSIPPALIGNTVGMFIGLGMVWLGLLIMLVGSVFLPPALGNLIAKDKFSAAFRIQEWWPVLKANLGGFLLAIALVLGIYSLMILAATSLYFTIILCFLLPFVFCIGLFVLGTMASSVFAVAHRDGQRLLAGLEN